MLTTANVQSTTANQYDHTQPMSNRLSQISMTHKANVQSTIANQSCSALGGGHKKQGERHVCQSRAPLIGGGRRAQGGSRAGWDQSRLHRLAIDWRPASVGALLPRGPRGPASIHHRDGGHHRRVRAAVQAVDRTPPRTLRSELVG